MTRTEIRKSLFAATLLVFKVIMRKISFQEFVKKYDNFYYYEALDGHEADGFQKRILDEFRIAIQFHAKVQIQVIDQLYLEDINKEQFIKAGRIDELEAMKRLNEIGRVFNIEEVIKTLKDSCTKEYITYERL